MIKRRNSTEIVQAAIRKLSAETNINYFGQGSVVKTLIEAMAREIELIYDSVDVNISQSRLSSASGAFLDIIGSQFGISRSPGGTGTITAADRAMRFYTVSGRLIDYLPYNSTTGIIPANTTISNRQGTINYIVSQSVTFPANATSVFVPISPVDPSAGSLNNAGPGTLITHSLGTNKVLCENVSGIITSTDPETDEEFRLRISRHINSRVTGGKAAVLQAAFAFPGVSDIKIHPYRYGAGSFEILIVPTSSNLSPNIVQSIKASVDSVIPYGIRAEVRGPDIVKVSMAVQINTNKGVSGSEKTVAINAAKVNLRSYIGSIQMGGELVVNRIISTILNSHPAINDVKILQININCKPQVISNYRLREDEVFDLDNKVSNPLLLV